MKNIILFSFPAIFYLLSCSGSDDKPVISEQEQQSTEKTAEIISVTFSGEENNYTFSVGIKSPDTGCDQYANWWEIITEEELIYRRILAHSHINEQPFVRPGGTVKITNDQIVYIRAHMNTTGYGNVIFKGSITTGFVKSTLDKNFAIELETKAPLPDGCDS